MCWSVLVWKKLYCYSLAASLHSNLCKSLFEIITSYKVTQNLFLCCGYGVVRHRRKKRTYVTFLRLNLMLSCDVVRKFEVLDLKSFDKKKIKIHFERTNKKIKWNQYCKNCHDRIIENLLGRCNKTNRRHMCYKIFSKYLSILFQKLECFLFSLEKS